MFAKPKHRRRKVAKPLPAWQPWPAVVLAVDTAARSGWSIWVAGKLVDSGEIDTIDEPALLRITRAVHIRAIESRLPCVLVLERPWGGTMSVIEGLGAARERWRQVWVAAGESERRIVRVYPITWRTKVLGAQNARLPRNVVRAVERRMAAQVIASERGQRSFWRCLFSMGERPAHEVGDDEAPAVLIGVWASKAAEVGKALRAGARREAV